MAATSTPGTTGRRHLSRAALMTLALTVGLAATVTGCSSDDGGRSSAGRRAAATQSGLREDLLAFAIDNLDNLEEFDNQVMINRIIDRLNEWIRLQPHDDDWQADPLLATLPDHLRSLPVVAELGVLKFPRYDGGHLQEAVWLRNVAQAACGDEIGDLARARNLFDWVVRNIQLDRQESSALNYTPGQTLLVGHGDAIDRAWLFILLARQLRLDAVMLAFEDADEPDGLRLWLPALLTDGQLYLFDPRLGLPIPGPNGEAVATLSQVAADEALLRQLDVDDTMRYPVEGSDLEHVVALVEASPYYLARRMHLFESQLAGDQKLVLSVAASHLADRLKEHPHVQDARLWKLPYETIYSQSQMSPEEQMALMRDFLPFQLNVLWLGRIHHLKGIYTGDRSANRFYQGARPADEDIEHPQRSMQEQMVLRTAKRNASYWLGLVAAERGLYEPAVEHLERRTLQASPGGPWTYGARYNLARIHEAEGRIEEAIALYEADTSPQRHGNLLRARRLSEEHGIAEEAVPDEASAGVASDAAAEDADASAPPDQSVDEASGDSAEGASAVEADGPSGER